MAFNLERFAETSTRVTWHDLDLRTFRTDPLDHQTLRCLRYMCDVEYHTSCYLRDLLVTPSYQEEAAGAFMTMWNREEFWHGEALAAVLAEHDVTVDYNTLKAKRVKLGWSHALQPAKHSVVSNLAGTDFVAVHMTWGAANELSAVAAYRRLATMTKHPTLSALLRRIGQQETRHVAFYTTQARQRLEASEKARTFVRFALNRFWKPVGSGIMSEPEVQHVMSHLFAGQGPELEKLDQKIQKLPGLTDLTVFQSAFKRLGVTM
ncbi:ferritin-like domain-containing protein [Kocuria sp.]|uniref:ferritin-like domain-containing protein n=1 Tax=Kocuria sp. TaxID=1871328 RepID=UPI0026DFE6E0|nr:ferritin-like domain-containing protein [Kocuria sp.]MDO5617641.1 ferritin-like domain-containing protein [Kocuria sp.]